MQHLPIRVQFRDPANSSGPWVEVPKDIGARVDGEGLIWLDSLGEMANNSRDCTFNGDLLSQDDYREGRIYLRRMRLNLAYPSDFRVKAIYPTAPVFNPNIDDTIRSAFLRATGGSPDWLGLARYQDEGQSFKWRYQDYSTPTLSPKYYGGTDGLQELTAPLTRDIPPGTEKNHALYAAQRTQARFVNPRRQAMFQMAGLQVSSGMKAGMRIAYVELVTPTGSAQYNLNGCVFTLTHDFLAQQTTLGGLLGEYGSA
jgi:hypothetical protein